MMRNIKSISDRCRESQNWYVSNAGLDDTQKKIVRRNFHDYQKTLRALARAEDKKTARRKQYHLLHSKRSRLVAIIRAAHRLGDMMPLKQAMALSENFTLRNDIEEPIRLKLIDKKDGGKRPIWNFGLMRRAHQIICSDVLTCQFHAPPYLYSAPGNGGRTAACQFVFDLIGMKGVQYFVQADIKDCFGSFNHDQLKKELPLPKRIVENCLLITDAHSPYIVCDDTINISVVRRGIPQGSHASNIIAAMLLTPVLDGFAGHGRVVAFGDDILVAAQDFAEASAIKKSLGSAFKESLVGPLHTKRLEIVSAKEGFNFLGYWFLLDYFDLGGARAVPSKSATRKFQLKLFKRCFDATFDQISDVADAYFKYWGSAFSLCDPEDGVMDYCFAMQSDISMSVALGRGLKGDELATEDFTWTEDGLQYKYTKSGKLIFKGG